MESSYIAQITDLWETPDEEKLLSGRWFYQPHEVDDTTVHHTTSPSLKRALM